MSEARIIDDEQEDRERFAVTDDLKAEWCMGMIRSKRLEIEKWKEHYDRAFASIKYELENDIAKFENMLQHYFMMQYDAGNVRKADKSMSYPLPSGKLVMKKQEPEYKKDTDEIIKWLEKNNPGFIKVEKSVKWQDLKKTLTISGDGMITEDAEVVPGITVVPKEDIFKVEVR